MARYVIVTGSVTYALKGRELLRKKGRKAWVEKISSKEKYNGCGYAIITEGEIDSARKILENSGIRILEINERA